MKKIFGPLLACLMLVCLSIVSSVGLPTYEPTQALIGYGMTIKLNGEEVQLHDVNGKQVYPLVRDGTTCIPVRGVSELLGLDVDWDGETNTVLLGLPVSAPANVWTGKNEGDAGISVWIANTTYLMPDGYMYGAGVQFGPEEGGHFTFHADNTFKNLSFTAYNKYTSGDVVVTVSNTATGETITTQTIKHGELSNVKCSIDGVNEVQVDFKVPKDVARSGYAVAAGVSVS